MRDYPVNAFHLSGKSHDWGSNLGYMMANVEYGLRHPNIAKDLPKYLKEQAKHL